MDNEPNNDANERVLALVQDWQQSIDPISTVDSDSIRSLQLTAEMTSITLSNHSSQKIYIIASLLTLSYNWVERMVVTFTLHWKQYCQWPLHHLPAVG